MIKKIVLGVLATGLVALLVVGAVNRTSTQGGGFLGLGSAQAQANGPQGGRGAGGGGGRGEIAPAAGQSNVLRGGQVAEQRGGGYGRSRQVNEAPAAGQGVVPGAGQTAGQRGGNGGYGRGRQVSEAPAAGQNSAAPNVGQAGVGEWVEVSGVVAHADEAALVVQTADGATLEVNNRP
ncbi:MAG: hypothetical protein FJ011_16230 [Chloroflexi bacterium]|nr:hypothetical protein [Chloroflexota bacterium]